MSEFGAPSKWIWLSKHSLPEEREAYVCVFRKAFELPLETLEKKTRCLLRISADSRYKLYVNGSFAEAGPAKGDNHVRYYDLIDILPYLGPGKNCIGIEVLRYPALHGFGNHSLFRAETPGLYVEEVNKASKEPVDQTWNDLRPDSEPAPENGTLSLSADETWRCRRIDSLKIIPENTGFAPLQFFEKVQGETTLAGWKYADYEEDDTWQSAHVYPVTEMNRATVPGNLLPRAIPFMARSSRHFSGVKALRRSALSEDAWNRMLQKGNPIFLSPNSEEIVEIDAGEEMCGYVSLRLAGGENAFIRILYAEAYSSGFTESPDGQKFPVKADRCDAQNGQLSGYYDEYTADGFGSEARPEIYTPIWFRTFRFIRLSIQTGEKPLTVLGFDYEETGYPLEVRSHVKTSDPFCGPVWDISLRTLRRCMHETYMDCPYYEQLQYAMDARNEILYTYAVSMDDRLARQCMDDFRRSQRYDGLLNCCAPDYEANVIPGFSIYYILMLYDHMMYFGDSRFIKGHLSCVHGILQHFEERLTPEGLVGNLGGILMESRYWSFIDWTAQWHDTTGVPDAVKQGPVTMESFLYLLGLMAASRLFRFMHRESTALEYENRAEPLREALRTYCRGENGLFTDGPGYPACSQHGQVFAVLTETVSPEEGRRLLLPTLEQPERYAQCSVAMMYYLFRALEKTNLYEWTDRKWDIWRNMVHLNLSTCVEDGVTGRSDCHAWGALALYEWPSVVLGVRPAEPGYRKIRIHPVPGALKSACGQAITPYGPVSIAWKKTENGTLSLSWSLPENMDEEMIVLEPEDQEGKPHSTVE